MPVVSKVQNAAMHSAADGNSTLGIPQAVGAEFTADQAPGSVKKLPKRVGKKSGSHEVKQKMRRGAISQKAAESKLKGYAGNDQEGIDASSR